MLVTFAGCGGGGSDSSQGSAASASAESSGDVKTVAIVQQMDNPAFDDMREGLIEELEAKGYGEDKVEDRIPERPGRCLEPEHNRAEPGAGRG